jgi:DNA-binding LytR/AlgR family response regulator
MIRTILIEDEAPARALLRSYLDTLPDWNLLAEFDNAIDALAYLSRNKVDVIFLDIQLPRLSGISFLRTLDHPPLVVITTAYSEHAVEAYELTVFDYLLKPYPLERFLKAVNRIQMEFMKRNSRTPFDTDAGQSHLLGIHGEAEARTEASPVSSTKPSATEPAHITVRADRHTLKIPVADILFVESQKEYARIVTTQREVRTRMGITRIEEMLTPHDFLRIHRSFLVAIAKVDSWSAAEVKIGKHNLPVGRLYQREVKQKLN